MSEYKHEEGCWGGNFVMGPNARARVYVNDYDGKCYMLLGEHPQQVSVAMTPNQADDLLHELMHTLQDAGAEEVT